MLSREAVASVGEDGASVLAAVAGASWQQQLIPRLLWQTHAPPFDKLPPGLARAATSWWQLNPEYTYKYFDDRALEAYVARQGGRVQGFARAWRLLASGAARADLWRYLVMYLEGGVFADLDSVLKHPLRTIIASDDEAVSGVGHRHHSLEQFVLAYRPKHPIMARVLQLSVLAVLSSSVTVEAATNAGGLATDWSQLQSNATVGAAAIEFTGPTQLYRAAIQALGKRMGHAFPSSTKRTWHCPPGARQGCVTILPGNYSCPGRARGAPEDLRSGCCDHPLCRIRHALNSFGGHVQFKYDVWGDAYKSDLLAMNLTYYGEMRMTAAESRSLDRKVETDKRGASQQKRAWGREHRTQFYTRAPRL